MQKKEDHLPDPGLASNQHIASGSELTPHEHLPPDSGKVDITELLPDLHFLSGMMEEVTADGGYCSEKNLLYLKENGIASYIILLNHEQQKNAPIRKTSGSITT